MNKVRSAGMPARVTKSAFTMRAQHPVHRGHRRHIHTLVEQLVVDGGRRLVGKRLTIEQAAYRVPLGLAQRPRLCLAFPFALASRGLWRCRR